MKFNHSKAVSVNLIYQQYTLIQKMSIHICSFEKPARLQLLPNQQSYTSRQMALVCFIDYKTDVALVLIITEYCCCRKNQKKPINYLLRRFAHDDFRDLRLGCFL